MKYSSIKLAYCFVWIYFFPLLISAQSNKLFFKHLTPSDGLTQSFINEFYTDSRGFVWMTGMEGVSRFDGIRCLSNNAIAPGINNHAVTRSIAEDKEGNIWFGTSAGLLQYSYKYNRFYLHEITSNKSFDNKINFIIAIDNENNILFGSNEGELLLYNIAENKIRSLQKFDTPESNDLGVFLFSDKIIHIRNSNQGISIYTLKNYNQPSVQWQIQTIPTEKEVNQMGYMPNEQTLFFCGSGRLYKHNLVTGKRKSNMLSEKIENNLIKFSQDNKGRLTISSKNGLFVVDTATMLVTAKVKYNRNYSNGVSGNNFYGMADRFNNLWIAALGKGVDYASLDEQKFTSFLSNKDSETFNISNFIRGIAQGNDENFYCATQSGVIVLDKNLAFNKRLKGFSKLAQVPDLKIVGNKLLIAADEIDGGLYEYDLATGIYKKHNLIFYKQNSYNANSYQINLHSPNECIIASVNSDFFKFNFLTGTRTFIEGIFIDSLFGKEPVYSFTSSNGNLYAGYNLTGFTIYRLKNNKYGAIYKSKSGFTVKHIIPAGDNRLWVATTDGLLLFDDKKIEIVKQFRVTEGLPNNIVYALVLDEKKNLWLSTNLGISYFEIAVNKFTNFTKEDGLQENEFNTHAVLKTKDGRIIFGGVNGLTVVNPEMVNQTPKNAILQLIKLKSDSILNPFIYTGEKKMIIPAGSNSFQSEWIAINFSNPKKCIIKYRLLGFENDWQFASNPAIINYSRLTPGRYTLEVVASNTKGEFLNEVKKLEIVVKAFWYQTRWFKVALVFVLALLSFYLIRNFYLRRLQAERQKMLQQYLLQQERDRITADLHDDIGATLSSMSIYSDLAVNVMNTQPRETKKMIDKISDTSKDLMNRMGDIIWSMKPANEEKYTIEARLKNYCTELLTPKNIVAGFYIDDKLAASITNPEVRKNLLLIAKEAINNIAKYSKATQVTFTLNQQAQKIVFTIKDNGEGFDKLKVSNGNGIDNIQQRCKLLGGICSIETSKGNGVCITCNFPIAIISHAH
jgi:signal transduction histidine kinase/streptogramin lyase